MKQTIIIKSEELKNRASHIINTLPLDPVHEVIVREHHKDRSASQNALYWKWLTIIATELGTSKEDEHFRFKREILIHIYERDDYEFAEMLESVRNVHKSGMKEEAIVLSYQIVKLVSTTTATVKQFSEYLTDIERDSTDKDIRLPHPEDLYYNAMGRG